MSNIAFVGTMASLSAPLTPSTAGAPGGQPVPPPGMDHGGEVMSQDGVGGMPSRPLPGASGAAASAAATPPGMESPQRFHQAPMGDPGSGSPAVKRAKMGPMAQPVVVNETWDQQGLMREVAKSKALIISLTEHVQGFTAKYNLFVDDAAQALMVRKQRIEQTEVNVRSLHDNLVETRGKLAASEIWATNHDKRMGELEQNIVRVVEHNVQQQLQAGMATTIDGHIARIADLMRHDVEEKVVEEVGNRASSALTHLRIQQEGM